MNKNTRKELNGLLAALLVKNGVIAEKSPELLSKIDSVVLGMDEYLYNLQGKKVPYAHAVDIWKAYNLEGGWSVKRLSEYYGVPVNTVNEIIKDKYW